MTEAPAIPGSSQGSSVVQGYSDTQFIAVLGEMWDLKINPHEFQQMKPEFVQKIYYAFLKDIGINLERLHQISPLLLDSIQSTEDCIGAIRLSVLVAHMKKYLMIIFDDDTFRMADVINPKPKRTRRFFAMIYNFMLFTERYLQKVEVKEEEVNILIEQRENMNTKLEELQHLISERQVENTKSEVAKEEEMRRIDEKHKEMEKCQEEKVDLRTVLDEYNLVLTSLNTTRKNMELKILELEEEKQKLKGLVIEAGEQEEIKKRDKKMALLVEDNQGKKDHQNQLQLNIKKKTLLKEKIDKMISILQEIEHERSKTEELQTTHEQKVLEISQLQEEIKNQGTQNMQSIEILKLTKTHAQSMLESWDHKKRSLEMEIKEQKGALEDLCRKLTEDGIAYNDGMHTISELEIQIKQSSGKIGSINAMVKESYKTLLDEKEEETQNLMKTFSEVAESVDEFKKLVR